MIAAPFFFDPDALARLAYDADLSGLIVLPFVAVHARHDPVVSPQALTAYARTVEAAGRGRLLALAMTDERDHSRLSAATYMSVLARLEAWIDTGERPNSRAFQSECLERERRESACRFLGADD